MTAYVQVPRDLSKVKEKVLFGLTRRQVFCFLLGGGVGLPVFFLVKKSGNGSLAMLGMIIVMMPFFITAMYEKDGQPVEKIVWYFVQAVFIRPKIRPYRTDNYYSALERQARVNREVKAIVEEYEKERATAGQKGKAGNQESGRRSQKGRRRSADRTADHSV